MSDVIPASQEANSRKVWIQFLAGPVLWSIHFLVSYLFVEVFCQAGWRFNILGLNGISFLLIVLTVLAILGTGLFGLKSYRNWRTINREGGLREQFRENAQWFEGPVDFLYFSGFLLSALFALIILTVGLPALFLQPC